MKKQAKITMVQFKNGEDEDKILERMDKNEHVALEKLISLIR